MSYPMVLCDNKTSIDSHKTVNKLYIYVCVYVYVCLGYNTKLYLLARLKRWIFGEWEVPFYCHNTQAHSYSDW